MMFQEYQKFAESNAKWDESQKLLYPALAVNGESGEVAEFVKKHMLRQNKSADDLTNEEKKKLALELGDVLYYLSSCATDIGWPLDAIAHLNMSKIRKRQEEGTLCAVERNEE